MGILTALLIFCLDAVTVFFFFAITANVQHSM